MAIKLDVPFCRVSVHHLINNCGAAGSLRSAVNYSLSRLCCFEVTLIQASCGETPPTKVTCYHISLLLMEAGGGDQKNNPVRGRLQLIKDEEQPRLCAVTHPA